MKTFLTIILSLIIFISYAYAGPVRFGVPSTEKLSLREAIEFIQNSGGDFPTVAELKKTNKIPDGIYWTKVNAFVDGNAVSGTPTDNAPDCPIHNHPFNWRLHFEQFNYAVAIFR
jgi:hypothetical protein